MTRLRLHGVPLEDDVQNQEIESWVFKDIQTMKLQLIVLYDYPCPVPLLAQNPEWACLEVNIDLEIYGCDWPDTASIPASTAPIIASLTMYTGATLIDLSAFWSCSRLECLTFRLEEGMDEPVEVEYIQSLPKSCCTLQFHDFVPFVQGLSELKGWHCKWGKGQRANSQNGGSPVVVSIPEVDRSPDKYFQLIRNTSCPEDVH